MSYRDKPLTCQDCGTAFIFTVADQEQNAEKGFTNEPSRCHTCRQQRKSVRAFNTGERYGRRYLIGGDLDGQPLNIEKPNILLDNQKRLPGGMS
jgi:Probable zinc-ribbon domain